MIGEAEPARVVAIDGDSAVATPAAHLSPGALPRDARMRVWLVPPIVVPILIVIGLIGFVSIRALL